MQDGGISLGSKPLVVVSNVDRKQVYLMVPPPPPCLLPEPREAYQSLQGVTASLCRPTLCLLSAGLGFLPVRLIMDCGGKKENLQHSSLLTLDFTSLPPKFLILISK